MLLFSHRMPSRLRADTLNSRGFPSRGATIESRGGACVPTPCDWIKALFRYPNSSPNFTMQKEDSPSHQNIGTYMKY
jgi:hypothetical protein